MTRGKTRTSSGESARQRWWGEHPLSPLANISWTALALYWLILLPIEGLSWTPRIAGLLWFLFNLALTVFILYRLRREESGEAAQERTIHWAETSLLREAFRRLRKNQVALVSVGLLVILLALCLGQRIWFSLEDGGTVPADGVSFFAIHLDHTRVNKNQEFRAPDASHWFGTDALGRDLFARVLRGGAVSFTVGFVATLVSLLIGVTWGAVAGYRGGRVDHYMMRIVDILYGLPFLFLVILILTLVNGLHHTTGEVAPVLDRIQALEEAGDLEGARRLAAENEIESIFSARAAVFLDGHMSPMVAMFIALGLVQWLTMARITRGQVLSLKEREFVAAARVSGAGTGRILVRHLVPNLLGPVVINATLTVPAVMLSEAFLSFLGLGISEPDCSWGSLAARGLAGLNVVKPYWWLIVYPAGAISLALFCLNFLGDGLRDALDPRERRSI